MNVRRMGLGAFITIASAAVSLIVVLAWPSAARSAVSAAPGPAPAPTPTLPPSTPPPTPPPIFGGGVSLSRAATVHLTVFSAADVAVTGGPVVIGVLCFLLLSRKRRIWLWKALRYRRKEVGNVDTFSG